MNPHKHAKATRILSLLVVGTLMGSCRGEREPSRGSDVAFSGERALALVETQVGFGPRAPGSAGHERIQGWLVGELNRRELSVKEQVFHREGVRLVNILGTRELAEGSEFIVLGAHYDTRPIADAAGSDSPVPGANDGGSGVAVLLELADVLVESELACRLEFAFFDAEDSGGAAGWEWALGSGHYVSELETKPNAVIIVDMVGDRDLQLPRELNSDRELQSEIWQTAEALGHDAFMDEPGFSMIDDHTAFVREGIPAVDIIDFEYPYWHTLEDTLDKVSAASLETVGRTLQIWLLRRCSP